MRNLLPAIWIITVLGCANNDLDKGFDCNTTNITVTLESKNDVTSCIATNGSISVSASNGQSPYLYSINGGDFTSNPVFDNLATGTYTVTVKDANGCQSTLVPSPTITSPGSTLTLSASTGIDTSCLTGNGSISVTAGGGTPPYTYKLNNGNFDNLAAFAGLENGNYTVTVKDSQGCTFSLNSSVSRGDTGISWNAEIQTIMNTNCAVSGCHNGNQSPNLSTLSGVQNSKASVKSRTGSRTMPPGGRTPLTDDQIKKIACWVDDGAKNN
jgi:hypothetical protein